LYVQNGRSRYYLNFFFFYLNIRASGQSIKVAAQNVQITPAVGDIVTFSYERQPRPELPVNAKIYCIRRDLEWFDVVNQYQRDKVFVDSMLGILPFQFHLT
jgi:hypothetical protein